MRLMDRFLRFVNNLDQRAVRAVAVSFGLLALVAAMFAAGRAGLIEMSFLQDWLEASSQHWYLALPATMLVFTALAYVGAPQFALIAACVLAFGPWNGFFYAWAATIVSGAATFYTGRFAGAGMVRRYGGRTVNNISAFVGRNGFWASLLVRIMPSAPFIVVNMAAGVSRMSFFMFISGLAIGVIPKTALVAFAGRGVIELLGGGNLWLALSLFLAVGGWILAMLIARRWMGASSDGGDEASDEAGRGEPLAIADAPSHKEDI